MCLILDVLSMHINSTRLLITIESKRSGSMRNLLQKNFTKKHRNRIVFQGSLGILVILALLLAACGGSSTNGSSAAPTTGQVPQSGNSSSQGSTSSSGQTSKSSSFSVPQYLIKSFQVNMLIKDTLHVASELQSSISTTDPRSTSAGIDYEQTGDNLYLLSLTFSLTYPHNPHIEHYLLAYPH